MMHPHEFIVATSQQLDLRDPRPSRDQRLQDRPRRARLSSHRQQTMEPLWSPVVAMGGNHRQDAKGRKPQKQAKTIATGCHRLPEKFHGKEGVSGSSPEEGSQESPANARFFLSLCTALRPACSGMEHVL